MSSRTPRGTRTPIEYHWYRRWTVKGQHPVSVIEEEYILIFPTNTELHKASHLSDNPHRTSLHTVPRDG
jgi:hypothetical protein